MRSVGAYDAKTHLPRLLDEVAAGDSITITKHGVPVAVLVPVHPRTGPTVAEAIVGSGRSASVARSTGSRCVS